MSDNFWEGAFKQMNTTGRWRESADKLKHSADLLFAAYSESCKLIPEERAISEDAEIAGVATLLYGLAMENILKAVLLKKNIAIVRDDGTVDWKADGAGKHDLLAICLSSKLLSLNDEQEKLLERISAFVCWAGKYPTPLSFGGEKEFQGLTLRNQPAAGPVMLPIAFRQEDKDSFEGIYRLLRKMAAGTNHRRAK